LARFKIDAAFQALGGRSESLWGEQGCFSVVWLVDLIAWSAAA